MTSDPMKAVQLTVMWMTNEAAVDPQELLRELFACLLHQGMTYADLVTTAEAMLHGAAAPVAFSTLDVYTALADAQNVAA